MRLNNLERPNITVIQGIFNMANDQRKLQITSIAQTMTLKNHCLQIKMYHIDLTNHGF